MNVKLYAGLGKLFFILAFVGIVEKKSQAGILRLHQPRLWLSIKQCGMAFFGCASCSIFFLYAMLR